MQKLKIIFFLVPLIVGSLVAAAGAAEPAANAPAPKPWQELQNHVAVLLGKRLQMQDELNKAILAKKNNRDPAQGKILDDAVQKAYRDLKETVAELNQKSNLLRFRYPERAAREDVRIYRAEALAELNQIEMRVGLGAKLDYAIQVIRRAYGVNPPEKKSSEQLVAPRGPASEPEAKNLIDAPIIHLER